MKRKNGRLSIMWTDMQKLVISVTSFDASSPQGRTKARIKI